MKKLILIGRSESGKTSLMQALRGENVKYRKTQYIEYSDILIDTPGEYMQARQFGSALALYSYEADIVGLIMGANESFSLYSPNITCMANREVIGIITKCDAENADVLCAEKRLILAGCKNIFRTSAYTGEGIKELLDYLKTK